MSLEAAKTWWQSAGLIAPFSPGKISSNNDGIVRDANGLMVCDCGGNEARADVIADLLNDAARAFSVMSQVICMEIQKGPRRLAVPARQETYRDWA